MEVDFSVELGPDEAALEIPWTADGGLCFYDLKHHPDLIEKVSEASQYPELRDPLVSLNSPALPLQTAKCDVWTSRDITPEEAIFAAEVKFVSYVDLLLSDARRYSLPEHETFARKCVALLQKVPQIPVSVELIVRRCYYHEDADMSRSRDGFYITSYVSGFGNDENEARRRWAIGLELMANAARQVSAT